MYIIDIIYIKHIRNTNDLHLWWCSRAFWPHPGTPSHLWDRQKPHWDLWKGLLHFALTGNDVHQHCHAMKFLPRAVHLACNACQNQIFFVKDLIQPCCWQYLERKMDGAVPQHAGGLDEAAMEMAEHGPAASEVLISVEAFVSPLQKCLQKSSSGTTAKKKVNKGNVIHFDIAIIHIMYMICICVIMQIICITTLFTIIRLFTIICGRWMAFRCHNRVSLYAIMAILVCHWQVDLQVSNRSYKRLCTLWIFYSL